MAQVLRQYTKSVNPDKFCNEVNGTSLSGIFDGVTTVGDALTVYLLATPDAGQIASLDDLVATHVNSEWTAPLVVANVDTPTAKLTPVDKFQMLNIFKSLFYSNAEGVAMPSLLPNNIVYDPLVSTAGMSTVSGVVASGNQIQLAIQGTTSSFDDCTDLVSTSWGNWTAYKSGTGTCTITSAADWYTTQPNSFKLSFQCSAYHEVYAALASNTAGNATDWSGYSAVMFDAWTDVDQMQGFLQVHSSGAWQTLKAVSMDSNGTNFNVVIPLPSSRAAVKGMRIGFYNNNYIGDGFGYIDNIRLVTGSTLPVANGYFVTTTKVTPVDITGVIITDKRMLPTNTGSITVDVSLDGGSHWKSNVATDTSLSAGFGGILERADGTVAWNTKRNLQLRYNFARGSDNLSPMLDDYAVIIDM
jgi:hypothetical protein